MARADDDHGAEFVGSLLSVKRETDREILRLMRRGKGPAEYVARCVREFDCVYVVWRAPGAAGGYAHLWIPGGAEPSGKGKGRAATFEVQDQYMAEIMAEDFAAGAFPTRDDWILVLRVRDPDGGTDALGFPKSLVVVDASPRAAHELRRLGFDAS